MAAVVSSVLGLLAPIDEFAASCTQVDLCAEDLAHELSVAFIADGLGEGRRQYLSSVAPLRFFEQIRHETEMTQLIIEETLPNPLDVRIVLIFLGALVVLTSRGLDANHIPFEIDPAPAPFGTLRGHIARANPLWRDFSHDVEALVMFHGPDIYISPSWYQTKRETAKVVPTWNYAVVHAHGALRFIDDRAWLRGFVEKLTNRHEAGRRDPWKVTDAPSEYTERQLGAIIGLEIPISRLVGKWKVSQNRPAQDREGVVEGLVQEGGLAAAAMAHLVRQAGRE